MTCFSQEKSNNSTIIVGRGILKSMDPSTVIIIKWPKPFKTRYFRNLLPDLQISLCKCCLKVSLLKKMLFNQENLDRILFYIIIMYFSCFIRMIMN